MQAPLMPLSECTRIPLHAAFSLGLQSMFLHRSAQVYVVAGSNLLPGWSKMRCHRSRIPPCSQCFC